MSGLRRVAVTVSAERLEEARAVFVELHPEGFEEVETPGGVELAAYTGAAGERRLRAAFGRTESAAVEEGWEDRWRAFHRPVRIGRLWIGPPWEPAPADALAVVIDPGRAFGTGAHPTTRLCLELLVELPRGSFLDVGCGSGVLAIAASRLGFAPVAAVDEDPVALEAARANVAANRASVSVQLADALRDPLPTADAATANVALHAVEQVAARLDCRLLVTSGYLAGERPWLPGFRPLGRREVDGWAADLFERK